MPIAATTRVFLTAAFALLLFAAPARAADKVKLTGVTVGFPPGAKDRADVSKFGMWAPVYATLEVLADVGEPAELLIEAPDGDEIATALAIPLNLTGLAPGTTVFAPDRGALGYARPAGSSSEVTVTVRTAKGVPLSEPVRVRLRPARTARVHRPRPRRCPGRLRVAETDHRSRRKSPRCGTGASNSRTSRTSRTCRISGSATKPRTSCCSTPAPRPRTSSPGCSTPTRRATSGSGTRSSSGRAAAAGWLCRLGRTRNARPKART